MEFLQPFFRRHTPVSVTSAFQNSCKTTNAWKRPQNKFRWGGCLVTVRPDEFLFDIAEIACGEAFKLFTELQLPIVHTACIVLSHLFFLLTSAGLSCFCNQCFLISLCVLQINYLTSLLPNTFNSGSDLTLYKLTLMWKIVHNASLLASNNRLQLVVLQHESQASDLRIFWEIIEKKSTSP